MNKIDNDYFEFLSIMLKGYAAFKLQYKYIRMYKLNKMH